MFNFIKKINRNERRLLNKLKSPKIYKNIIEIIFFIFGLTKKYLSFRRKNKSAGIISVTSDKVFWNKISYIDDFIVHKKSRWKWLWKKLFDKILNKIKKEEKSDYVILVTKDDRKASHWLYKKFWFSMIWLWIGYLAYKKIKKYEK